MALNTLSVLQSGYYTSKSLHFLFSDSVLDV